MEFTFKPVSIQNYTITVHVYQDELINENAFIINSLSEIIVVMGKSQANCTWSENIQKAFKIHQNLVLLTDN